MAKTNFGALNEVAVQTWSKEVVETARNYSHFLSNASTDSSGVVQKVTELSKSDSGDRATITLVHPIRSPGVAGDSTLEDRETKMTSSEMVIKFDQIRNAVRNTGKMADMTTVVNFRKNSRNELGFWLAELIDELVFLTLSGISYAYRSDGTKDPARDELLRLAYAGDVTAPTGKRHVYWDSATDGLKAGNTAELTAADTITWEALVKLKAAAVSNYIKPIMADGGVSYYRVYVTPDVMADLKLDDSFKSAVQSAMPRSNDNLLFKDANTIYVDGLAITAHRNVYHNTNATTKWGSGNAVEGARVLLCGRQALAMADLGIGNWVEKKFDFENQQAVAYGKIMGLKKSVYHDVRTGSKQDFGVIAMDVAQKSLI